MAESSTPLFCSACKPHQPLDFNFPKHSLFFIMVCFLIADHIQGNESNVFCLLKVYKGIPGIEHNKKFNFTHYDYYSSMIPTSID